MPEKKITRKMHVIEFEEPQMTDFVNHAFLDAMEEIQKPMRIARDPIDILNAVSDEEARELGYKDGFDANPLLGAKRIVPIVIESADHEALLEKAVEFLKQGGKDKEGARKKVKSSRIVQE